MPTLKPSTLSTIVRASTAASRVPMLPTTKSAETSLAMTLAAAMASTLWKWATSVTTASTYLSRSFALSTSKGDTAAATTSLPSGSREGVTLLREESKVTVPTYAPSETTMATASAAPDSRKLRASSARLTSKALGGSTSSATGLPLQPFRDEALTCPTTLPSGDTTGASLRPRDLSPS